MPTPPYQQNPQHNMAHRPVQPQMQNITGFGSYQNRNYYSSRPSAAVGAMNSNDVGHYLINDNTPTYNPTLQQRGGGNQFSNYYENIQLYGNGQMGNVGATSLPPYYQTRSSMPFLQTPMMQSGQQYINTQHAYGSGSVPPPNPQRYAQEPLADEDYSEKLIAFARFNRNSSLIKEIFSETVMPDPRQVVSTNRLEILKEQVRVLEQHYKKVDLDLAEVEKACLDRKRKLTEGAAAYNIKYAALCNRPPVGVKTYSEMFLKHYNHLKAEAERQQWEQTLAWAQLTAATSANSNASENQQIQVSGLAEILGIHETQNQQQSQSEENETPPETEN